MKYSVAYAAGSDCFWQELEIEGAEITAEQAIQRAKLLADFPSLDLNTLKVGVFGKTCALTQVINDGDRVEVYLPTREQEIQDAED